MTRSHDFDRRRRAELEAAERAAVAAHDRHAGQAYRQAVRADAVDDMARAANRDASEGMATSGRMWRQARDEAATAASEQAGDGSTWLPPGARPPRPAGAPLACSQRPPGWKPWWRRLFS